MLKSYLALRFQNFIPNKDVSLVVGVVFVVAAVLLAYRLFRNRDWWGSCLPIGALCYALGFFFRVVTIEKHQDSRGWLILGQIFIACSPAAFLAFNYIVHGRLVVNSLGARHSRIRPTRVAFVFVSSDIATFLVQAAGSGLMITKSTVAGKNIFLIGLVLQTLSYLVFCALFVSAVLSAKEEGIATGTGVWWEVVQLLGFPSVPIMVRCIFRCVEDGLGRSSVLSIDEVYFYCLDSLPLLLATSIYVVGWPGDYIDSGLGSVAEYPPASIEMNTSATVAA
ncbi:hypothetical protein FISHEDRAFT_50870 [Fistulina hepatica ATCC 64428]|uniref:RTA1 like protein n=1 Tax=Fistulina hepatica ATCC 64428 TaxID=1128425 RepID=A0A0D7A0U5_9AGAR|nr:hypothetical protein FISHEDRAFT_50870 [Fistulina hepatica ATCC 64428]